MTVTNTSENGSGVQMRNAKVELFDVALTGCNNAAFYIPPTISATTVVATRCEFANSYCGAAVDGSSTSATFNNCVFNDNSSDGIFVATKATIHLHEDDTAIHSNGKYGINVYSGKVIIHLPSHHNTSYNNTLADRLAYGGGTITNVED